MKKKTDDILETVEYASEIPVNFHFHYDTKSYPKHWHNAVEIIVPVKNEFSVAIGDETVRLNENDVLIIPSGELHKLLSSKPNGRRAIFRFDVSSLSSVLGFINAAYIYSKVWILTPTANKELHNRVLALLREIIDECLEKKRYYEVSFANKLIDITLHLIREPIQEELHDFEGAGKRREQINKFNSCVDYINKNFTENLSLDTVSQAIGFSKFYFSRWFQQYAGVPFNDYLIKARLSHAESMLISSAKPVTEIALDSGFQSTATFNRIFKEHKKCTPTEYRNFFYLSDHKEMNTTEISEAEDMEATCITMKTAPFDKPFGVSRLNGDGTFVNPFIWADIPDPDVIRVGDRYYMSSTTMYFNPGCPIMRSFDLVNWEIVSYVYDILDDSDGNCLRNGANAYGKGTWASSLRYRNGTFYLAVASFSTSKTYIFQTEDIESGQWRRYTIEGVYHDMSLLFDDDGRVYLSFGAGTIRVIELTSDATAVKPDGINSVLINKADVGGPDGLPAEGSHFYKLNGIYYLFLIAWPKSGTQRRIELCYRSANLLGPYEGRVIMDDDLGYRNKGAAQGGIVDTPDGDWYAMLFQDHDAVGRIPVLVPLKWQDGWPVLGVNGKVPQTMPLPINGYSPCPMTVSDEFYNFSPRRDFSAANGTEYRVTRLQEYHSNDEPDCDTEIIENGDFKEGTKHWEYTEIADIRVINDDNIYPSPVLAVTGRATTGSGPKQIVTGKVTRGGVYELTAKVKYLSGPPYMDFIISVYTGTNWESIRNMCTAKLTRGEWGEIKGTFTMPTDAELSESSIFIETPWVSDAKKSNDLMDFYVASVSMIAKTAKRLQYTMLGENDANGSYLPLNWQWNHNPNNNLWSLTERLSFLRLKSGFLSNTLMDARNTLTQRTFGPECSGVAALETAGMKDGDFAGLAALQNDYGYVGVKQVNGKKFIIMANAASGQENEIESVPIEEERVYLKVDFNFNDDTACFYYSLDEIQWYAVGDTLHMKYKLSHFTGYRYALFYYATQTVGGYADFDYFRAMGGLARNNESLVVLNGSFGSPVEVRGTYKKRVNIPIYLDALPEGSYSLIKFSMPIPSCLSFMEIAFCNENIRGNTDYAFKDGQLQITVSGDVAFKNKTSDLFAMIKLRVNEYVREDTTLLLRPDYLYVEGGNAVYDVHSMTAQITLKYFEYGAKAKKLGYTNPLINHKYGADPWALVYDGRVYIYLTGDVYDYDDHGKLKENNYSKINKIVVISSEDLINWTDHGEINVAGSDGIAAWAAHSWAPAVACKNIGGEDRFFLYFANDASNIGVLTAGSPTGPWTDPLGKPLIHRGIPGVKDVTWCFDPAVLVDDDGSGYLYFGGGLPSRTQQDALHPKTARVIKLGGDMISTDGEAVVIDAPALFEDSGINKINGWYYYSYCSNFSGEHPKGYPPYGEIAYMLSKSPMGPFVYAGTVLKNPQHFFGAGGNNHHCIFNFKGEWYIAYHAQTLGLALGRQKGYRSPHIDKLSFYQNGAIRPVEAGYISEPPVVRVNPYTRNEAEAFAWGSGVTVAGTGSRYVTDIHNGDWLAVANVDFPYWEELLFTVRVASDVGGEIEVRVDNPQGMLVGVLGIGSTGGSGRWEEMSCRMAAPFGLHHLFFVFKGDSERNLFDFDYWTFTE